MPETDFASPDRPHLVRPRSHPLLALLLTWVSLGLGAPIMAQEGAMAEEGDATAPTFDAPAFDAPEYDTSGFIYGRVETRYEVYEGRLRWDEEAFWDQYLDSNKERTEFGHWVPSEHRMQKRRISLFGSESTRTRLRSQRRGFMARFGDIDRIEPHSRGWSTVTMKDGSRFELEGGGDIWSRLRIQEPGEAEIRLAWERIRRIVFLPTPKDFPTTERRLHGKVFSRHGIFEGSVHWDKDECTSLDELDGDDRSGERRTIPMGEIRELENLGNTTRVVLASGEELELGGTNDVNRGHRGLWVDDPRFGRVLIPWRAFERLELVPTSHSGPGYEDLAPGLPLAGVVLTREGQRHQGHVVWDVDEARTWEILNGRVGSKDSEPSADSSLSPEPGTAIDESTPPGAMPQHGMDVSMGSPPDGEAVSGPTAPPEPPAPPEPEGDSGSGWAPALEYDIPFGWITSVEVLRQPHPETGEALNRAVRATLKTGETVELAGTQDVDEDNAGLLVFPARGGDPTYIPWDAVSRVDFDFGETGVEGVETEGEETSP